VRTHLVICGSDRVSDSGDRYIHMEQYIRVIYSSDHISCVVGICKVAIRDMRTNVAFWGQNPEQDMWKRTSVVFPYLINISMVQQRDGGSPIPVTLECVGECELTEWREECG
jgi:hypothetical protein